MPIIVDLIARVIKRKIIFEKNYRVGDFLAILLNASSIDDPAPEAFSSFDCEIGKGSAKKTVNLELLPMIHSSDYQKSLLTPIMLFPNNPSYWYYKDKIYQPRRSELLSEEVEEIILRIKLHDLEESQEINILQKKVTNLITAIENQQKPNSRRRISDDVQIAVFSRDNGQCVKCESELEIHFDHIIPLSKGGSDTVENLQILCRSCNLKKSNTIGG